LGARHLGGALRNQPLLRKGAVAKRQVAIVETTKLEEKTGGRKRWDVRGRGTMENNSEEGKKDCSMGYSAPLWRGQGCN